MLAQIGFFAVADDYPDDEASIVTLDLRGPAQAFLEGDDGTTAYSFTIYRDGDDLSGSHSVRWSVVGNDLGYGYLTANAEDFDGGVLPGDMVTFDPGETSKSITIFVRGDHTPEVYRGHNPDPFADAEAFIVQLSDPTEGALVSDSVSVGFIRDDDFSFVSVLFDPENVVVEGNDGAAPLSFTILRDSPDFGESATVDWAVVGGGADAADFVGGALPSGSVTFAPGETEKVVTVQIAGDSDAEDFEGFRFQISDGAGVLTDRNSYSAQAGIINDDSVLDIEATAPGITEGNTGSSELGFWVHRSSFDSPLGTISVNWSVSGGVDAGDFLGGMLPGGTITFAEGETERFIALAIGGDTVPEPDEAFTITLTNPSLGATIGMGSASAVIRNDDGADPYPGIGFIHLTEAGDTGNYERSGAAVAVRGLGGNDDLTGSRFADILLGEAGNDLLRGGNGADTIEGGAGSDRMQGGAGDDVFVFRKADFAEAGSFDHIIDFQGAGGAPIGGNDLLEFHGFAAGSTLTFHRLANSHRNGALYKVTDAGDGSLVEFMVQFADGNYTGTTLLGAGDWVFVS